MSFEFNSGQIDRSWYELGWKREWVKNEKRWENDTLNLDAVDHRSANIIIGILNMTLVKLS